MLSHYITWQSWVINSNPKHNRLAIRFASLEARDLCFLLMISDFLVVL